MTLEHLSGGIKFRLHATGQCVGAELRPIIARTLRIAAGLTPAKARALIAPLARLCAARNRVPCCSGSGVPLVASDEQRQDAAATLWQQHWRRRQRSIRRMKMSIKRQLRYAMHETLRNLEHGGSGVPPLAARDKQDAASTPIVAAAGAAFDVLFDKIKFGDQLTAALRADTLTALQDSGQEFLAEIGSDDPFELPPPQAREFLRGRENKLAGVPDEVFDGIKRELQAGHDAGESRAKIAKRIRDKFAAIEGGRAEVIASTETSAAYGFARDKAMQQAGVGYKKWLASGLSNMREAHREADGQVVPIGEPFIVDGEELDHPGDEDGSPGNVINCHCVAVASEGSE